MIELFYKIVKEKNGDSIKHGDFTKIQSSVFSKNGIIDITLTMNVKLICARVKRGYLKANHAHNQVTRMLHVEALLFQIVLWKQDVGQLFTPKRGLNLTNSFIDQKLIQEVVKEFQCSKIKD